MAGEEKIVAKAILEGSLELLSPLLIGSGESSSHERTEQDIEVLKNDEGVPFIPGTSLIGALRHRIEDQYQGDEKLFFGDQEREQSAVRAEDIVFSNDVKITFRDGVRIDDVLGTAVNGAKYTYEAVERGASAPVRLEIALRGMHTDKAGSWQEANLSPAVIDNLCYLRDILVNGIALGANTAKGFGQVKLQHAKLGLYDFHTPAAVKFWLAQESPKAEKAPKLLTQKSQRAVQNAKEFLVDADFAISSSLLIRENQINKDGKSIAVMKKSNHEALIPGTTIKGVLRHRAVIIAKALGYDQNFIDQLLGAAEAMGSSYSVTEGRIKSRLQVSESYISLRNNKDVIEKEITRNRIDRFTGGTIESALFTTKPLYQGTHNKSTLHIRFRIQDATAREAGLALFLLKDLWQGNLTLGGEAGVGRGKLEGKHAIIMYNGQQFELDTAGAVKKGNQEQLEQYAQAFVNGASGQEEA